MEVSTVFFSFLNFSSFPLDFIEVRIVIDIWESRTETGHFIFKEVKKGWGAAPCLRSFAKKGHCYSYYISLLVHKIEALC